MSVVNLLILRWVAFTGAEAISIVFSHPSTAGSQIFRKSSESHPRASRLDAPPSCCRGGEGGNGLQDWSQSRPYNQIYIPRKPRPVPACAKPLRRRQGRGASLFALKVHRDGRQGDVTKEV